MVSYEQLIKDTCKSSQVCKSAHLQNENAKFIHYTHVPGMHLDEVATVKAGELKPLSLEQWRPTLCQRRGHLQ